MNLGIRYKLLITFFIATIVVVGCMLFFMKWSFDRGFLKYVNTIEEEVHKNIIENLTEEYSRYGNWEFLRDNHRKWREIVFNSYSKTRRLAEQVERKPPEGEISRPPPEPGFNPTDKHRVRPPPYYRGAPPPLSHKRLPRGNFMFRSRVMVFDQSKELVIGFVDDRDKIEMKPIENDTGIIGYLGVRDRRALSATHDLKFSEQQGRTFILIAIATVLITSILILPLSSSLLKPIKRLITATRDLASGNYEVRIPVQKNDEIGQLSKDFNTLAKTLQQNESARRQWIADISHELRTPLTVLRGEIEAMQDGIREINKERVEALHNEVMNLNKLVNDLYELSLSDIGALSYQKETVELGELLETTIASLRDDFSHKQINTSLEINRGEPVHIFADPDRLQQLFNNLLTNSLRYTDAGGELKISVNLQEDKAVIDFQDSAPGVREGDLPKLFERLYRGDSSRNRATGGAGLGLSICKNIVDAHNGKITARQSPLGGVWISIELPGGEKANG